MKLLRDDVKRAEDESPLVLFKQGIRTDTTRYTYTSILRRVVCEFLEEVLEGTFEERVAQLVKYGREDPKWTRDLLVSLVGKLRGRTGLDTNDPDYLNPTSISSFFKPIKKLFDMNDVVMSWKRIYATYPELDNMRGSSGWTRTEIATMLKHARNTQDRAIILLLASSGVRIGAVHSLNWGDLAPVYRVDDKLTLDPGELDGEIVCAVLEVYRGSPESYNTFVTPEAFAALREYGRWWAKAKGRQAGPKDPMFVTTVAAHQRTANKTIQKRVNDVVVKAGLHDTSKDSRRFRVPLMNGFRRFFNKTCKAVISGDSVLGSLIMHEFMMGHNGMTRLDENYFKTDVLELAAAYLLAAPDLTIDDADRLRLSNRRLSDKVRMAENEKDEKMARMEKEMARLRDEKDERAARMEKELSRMKEEAARLKDEKDGKMARMEKELADLRGRGSPGTDLVEAFKGAANSDGVPKTVVESLTGMMQQLEESRKADMQEMQEKHDAQIDELKRALDMERSGSWT